MNPVVGDRVIVVENDKHSPSRLLDRLHQRSDDAGRVAPDIGHVIRGFPGQAGIDRSQGLQYVEPEPDRIVLGCFERHPGGLGNADSKLHPGRQRHGLPRAGWGGHEHEARLSRRIQCVPELRPVDQLYSGSRYVEFRGQQRRRRHGSSTSGETTSAYHPDLRRSWP